MSTPLRVVTWNCRRATESSILWSYLLELDPDIALLQEAGVLPSRVRERFAIREQTPGNREGQRQRFNTAVLVRGEIGEPVALGGPAPWVDAELARLAGNLVACQLRTNSGSQLKVVSVYSPAWPVDRGRLIGVDVSGVKLTQNKDVWCADLLWASLKRIELRPDEHWIIAGDFNASETFDLWQNRPRGNKEFLDRMAALGLVECLRSANGGLTPTYRNTDQKTIKHQMDHLFTTRAMADSLIFCCTGSRARVFDAGLSDHLPIIAEFGPGVAP